MIKELFENISAGQDIRKSLIALKQELKQEEARIELLALLQGDFSLITELLNDPDPKVRKNAAMTLGRLDQDQHVPLLYQAYQREEQLFVKSEYLKAMANLDCSSCKTSLEKRLEELQQVSPAKEEEKHFREELAALRKLVDMGASHKKHRFQGYDDTWEIILSTGKKHQNITAKQLKDGKSAILKSGVRLITSRIKSVLEIRTYRELLFLLNSKQISGEPKEAARALAESNLLLLLEKAFQSEDDFYFRLSLHSPRSLEQRSAFTKKCAFALEQETGGRLKNSASDYEVEIRLMENRKGQFLPLIKLSGLEDERFSYRKHTVAASIRPEQAALIAMLAKQYMKENAQVLDPFCGVGTMLIERDRVCRAEYLYGVDIFGEAIIKARENAELAGREIYYINRDFSEFTHEYLFDEIITNMPDRGKRDKEAHDGIYQMLFDQAQELLKGQGRMFVYSNEKNYVKKQLRLHKQFTLLQEYGMDDKECYFLFIIEKK